MGISGALSSAMARAKKDENYRLQLQSNPKQVLEREFGRELSKEEVEAAVVELKRHGIKFDAART